MISGLNSSNQQFMDNLRRIQTRLNTDQLQIASGLRMQQVSDTPDRVSELLQARASLSASQQVTSNLGNVKAVDMGEQTLEGAVQLFDQVQDAGRGRRHRNRRPLPPARRSRRSFRASSSNSSDSPTRASAAVSFSPATPIKRSRTPTTRLSPVRSARIWVPARRELHCTPTVRRSPCRSRPSRYSIPPIPAPAFSARSTA